MTYASNNLTTDEKITADSTANITKNNAATLSSDSIADNSINTDDKTNTDFDSANSSIAANNYDDFDQQHLWHPYAALPPSYPNLVIDRADGVTLYTKNGDELLDGMSSWWAAVHGYNHPALNTAITEQLGKMAHVMFGGLTHQPAIDLGKKLLDIVPKASGNQKLEAVFYADSGSVAVEVALKMALQYQLACQRPQKNQIATTRSGYYGDTWHAMSVCDPENGMHSIYGKQLPVQLFVDMPPLGYDQALRPEDAQNLERFFADNQHTMAAFIIEPIVQGAGGMRFYSPDYLKIVRKLCNDYQVLLIADEIATGFGRTGRLFACEHADICPDIMTVGKALTGGYMTFAATICSRKVAQTITESDYPALMHGPTFMGNPLACAVAGASLNLLIAGDYAARACEFEQILKEQLAELATNAAVQDVRCLGAIGVIELKDPIDMAAFQPLLLTHKIWVRPFGKLLYMMPPLVMTDDELKTLCHRLKLVLNQYLGVQSNH